MKQVTHPTIQYRESPVKGLSMVCVAQIAL